MPIVKCDYCGRDLVRQKNRLKSKHHFCDKKCKGFWMTGKYFVENPSNHYRIIKIDKKSVKEHRFIVEKAIGRKLKQSEHVHHVNGNKLDNRIENLEVIDAGEHTSLHHIISVDEKNIIEMRIAGSSICGIAKSLGVSPGTIRRRLQSNDIDTSKINLKWDIKKALELIDSGVSRERTAKALGITRSTLVKQLDKLDTKFKDKRYKISYDPHQIKRFRDENKSIRSIATHFNLSYSGLRKYMAKNNIT